MSRHWWRSRWRSRGELARGALRYTHDPRILALLFIALLIAVWFIRGD